MRDGRGGHKAGIGRDVTGYEHDGRSPDERLGADGEPGFDGGMTGEQKAEFLAEFRMALQERRRRVGVYELVESIERLDASLGGDSIFGVVEERLDQDEKIPRESGDMLREYARRFAAAPMDLSAPYAHVVREMRIHLADQGWIGDGFRPDVLDCFREILWEEQPSSGEEEANVVQAFKVVLERRRRRSGPKKPEAAAPAGRAASEKKAKGKYNDSAVGVGVVSLVLSGLFGLVLGILVSDGLSSPKCGDETIHEGDTCLFNGNPVSGQGIAGDLRSLTIFVLVFAIIFFIIFLVSIPSWFRASKTDAKRTVGEQEKTPAKSGGHELWYWACFDCGERAAGWPSRQRAAQSFKRHCDSRHPGEGAGVIRQDT